MRAFVNYRTGDGEITALLVSRYLCERIGASNVFYDSRSIPPGTYYDDELLRNVWRSDVLVAVIGSRWVDLRGEDGRRLLDDPGDWVRREIVEAFRHAVRVIPFLVGGAPLPRADQLPDDLAELPHSQYVTFDLRYPEAGLSRLAETLVPPTPPAREDEARHGGGQRGGIGRITANTVTAVTDARGPVHIGDRFRPDEDDT